MNSKKITKTLTNILLLGSFMITYFLDLTGLELHQYIGIGAGLLLLLHILTHLKWIEQVSNRFLEKLTLKVRVYYLLDVFLLFAIVVIVLSGIAVSTWVNLSYTIYPLVRDIHVISSIAGLSLLVIKLLMHWKYFSNLITSLPGVKQKQRAGILQPQSAAAGKYVSRREALVTIGTISAVGFFGLYKAVNAMIYHPAEGALPDPQITKAGMDTSGEFTPAATDAPQYSAVIEPTLETTSEGGQRRRRGRGSSQSALSEDIDTLVETPTAAPTLTESTVELPVSPTLDATEVPDCVIRCTRACAYPGKCRRYVDENGNYLCDLGECLPV